MHETEDVGGDILKTYTTTANDEYGDLLSEGGDELYHQFDAQHNTIAVLDETGFVDAEFQYDAWLNITSSTQEELPLVASTASG